MADISTGHTGRLTYPAPSQSGEPETPALLATVVNDFPLYNPSPESHQGARSLNISLHVTPGLAPFPQITNPYFPGCKLLFVLLGFDASRQMDPFSPVTPEHLGAPRFT